jgi:hypothetical protein
MEESEFLQERRAGIPGGIGSCIRETAPFGFRIGPGAGLSHMTGVSWLLSAMHASRKIIQLLDLPPILGDPFAILAVTQMDLHSPSIDSVSTVCIHPPFNRDGNRFLTSVCYCATPITVYEYPCRFHLPPINNAIVGIRNNGGLYACTHDSVVLHSVMWRWKHVRDGRAAIVKCRTGGPEIPAHPSTSCY